METIIPVAVNAEIHSRLVRSQYRCTKKDCTMMAIIAVYITLSTEFLEKGIG
jgi:hypothetical protein